MNEYSEYIAWFNLKLKQYCLQEFRIYNDTQQLTIGKITGCVIDIKEEKPFIYTPNGLYLSFTLIDKNAEVDDCLIFVKGEMPLLFPTFDELDEIGEAILNSYAEVSGNIVLRDGDTYYQEVEKIYSIPNFSTLVKQLASDLWEYFATLTFPASGSLFIFEESLDLLPMQLGLSLSDKQYELYNDCNDPLFTLPDKPYRFDEYGNKIIIEV